MDFFVFVEAVRGFSSFCNQLFPSVLVLLAASFCFESPLGTGCFFDCFSLSFSFLSSFPFFLTSPPFPPSSTLSDDLLEYLNPQAELVEPSPSSISPHPPPSFAGAPL